MTRKRSEIKKIVEKLEYIFIDEYSDLKSKKRVIISDKIGYKYNILLSNFVRKDSIVKFVHKNNPYSLQNISLWLKLNNSEFKLSDGNFYIGAFNKLKLYHKKCGEEFFMNWANLSFGCGCGVCHGKQVGKYNNLFYLQPVILKEWHPTKNILKPNEVTMSSRSKIWWICSKGHEYLSTISNRKNGSGCKKCSDEKFESVIATEIKEYFKENYNGIEEYKVFINPKTKRILPFDIYLQKEMVFIEVHGEQHYKNNGYFYKSKEEFEKRKSLDRMKRKFARQNGIYIEIDLRKIKTTIKAIEHIKKIIGETH